MDLDEGGGGGQAKRQPTGGQEVEEQQQEQRPPGGGGNRRAAGGGGGAKAAAGGAVGATNPHLVQHQDGQLMVLRPRLNVDDAHYLRRRKLDMDAALLQASQQED